jgi:hypothetical protein
VHTTSCQRQQSLRRKNPKEGFRDCKKIHPSPPHIWWRHFEEQSGALDAEIGELEKLIDLHKATVLKRFDDDAKKSIEEVVKAFLRDITRNPPQDLMDQLGAKKPSTEEAKDYLRHIVYAAFPKADEVAESMRIIRVVPDVTWNTLNESGFIDWLKAQFPHRKDLHQPFEQYHAARSAEIKAATNLAFLNHTEGCKHQRVRRHLVACCREIDASVRGRPRGINSGKCYPIATGCRLAEHVERAAAKHGALPAIGQFLRDLREEDWFHLG